MVSTVVVCVSSLLAAADTSTLEVTAANSSCKCSTGDFEAVTSICCSTGLNPGAVTLMVYSPTGTPAI